MSRPRQTRSPGARQAAAALKNTELLDDERRYNFRQAERAVAIRVRRLGKNFTKPAARAPDVWRGYALAVLLTTAAVVLREALARQCAQVLGRGRLYEDERLSRRQLERRVQQATAELLAANQALQREIAERREVQQRLEQSREAERARLARELHDELGGDLTGLIFSVSWLLARPDVTPEAREQLTNLSEDIEATLWSVRRLATELHPLIVQRLGLLGALEWQFGEFLTRTDLDGEFTSALSELPLADEPATACFRIFQEALTNVARHAQATWVEARVDTQNEHIIISVADNGRGLPQANGRRVAGLGHSGMRERAAMLAGKLDIRSVPGRGTAVVLKLPRRAERGSHTAV